MAQMKAQGSLTIIDTNDIESITVEYARNQSTSSPPTSGWSTTRPTWEQGYYIWQRTRIHKTGTSDSEDTFGTAVCITGSTGQTGASLTVSSIRYAISTTESQPVDSSFTYTTVPTVAEGSWLWTKTEYSDGSKIYTKSKQGKSGDSVTVTKVEYQSGTSPTTAPTGTWNTSIPTVAEGNYLWTKTTYSDGNYSYTVAKQGQSGTSVTISSTSVQYQVGSSATTAPTGTWQNSVQATTTGQYLWTRTIVTYSDSSSTTSYSVAAHGSTGTSVSVSSIKYAVTTTESQPSDSSFSTTFPSTVAEGSWLWTLTTYSNGSKMYTKSKQGKSGDDGRGLTATETKYTNVASGTTQTQVEALAESAWVTNVPSYDASKPDYWIRVKNTYDKAPTTVYIYYKDNATSESLYNAAMANSIAQSANENANGAMSQAAANVQSITRLWYATSTHTKPSAPSSEITSGSASTYGSWSTIKPTATDTYRYFYYCDQSKTGGGIVSWSEVIEDTSYLSTYEINALDVRTKNFFKGKDSSYDGWFASGRTSSEGLDEADATTYYYNARFGATHITLGYNKTPVIDLDGSSGAIKLYSLPTINSSTKLVTTAGKLGMQLTNSALSFYGSSTSTADVTLNSSGLNITNGSIVLGSTSSTTNGSIALSNIDFTRSISGTSRSNLRLAIGQYFGVKNDGTLYASNAVISGTMTIGANSTINGTNASTVVSNASTGAGAASDLATYKTTVANTYATQEALSDVEGQIPTDLSELNNDTGYITSASVPTKVSQLTNDSGFQNATDVSGAINTATSGLAAKTDAVYRTQRIYYRKTSSGAPGGNTTWLTSSGTGYGNWSLKIPQLTSGSTKYPYLYTAVQTQTISQYNSSATTNNCTCSTVLLDDSTTVIDGGTITTGKVAANYIDVETLIANNSIVVGSQISDMATKTYVGNQGYQTADNVNTIIGQTNVSELSDGSDYTKTANLGNTTAVQNAAKTASNYLGDTDSNAGVTLKAQNGTTTANTNTSNYIKINTSGLEVFKGGVSVAQYGDTARIGKTNNSRFLMNASSLQAYNSSNVKYFEVSASGMTYGTNTVASTSYADGKASAAQTAAETTAQGYANTAEANASYSVEIQVTSIDYVNNSATLVAIPYYQGSTTMPTGVTLSYQWYKNGTALANTSTAPTISGATTNTLQLGEGTDFGSNTTNAIYTCVIS